MKKFILIALFSLIFLPLAALGQSSENTEDQPSDTVVEQEEPDNLEGTTRGNRRDSTIYIGISPVGVHFPTLVTHPFSLGVFVGESLYAGGELGFWEIDYEDEDDGYTAVGDFSNVGGVARYYTGNSFYLSVALHQRTWDVDVTYTYDSGFVGYGTIASTALVGSLGFGNQWISDFGFTFGIEYLVLSGALSSSVEAEVIGLGGGPFSEAQAELEDIGETLNTISAFSGALIFSFGWSF